MQELQDSSKQAGPTCRRAALTVAQWTSSLSQPDRPPAYRAALLLMQSSDFVIRMAGVSLLSVRTHGLSFWVCVCSQAVYAVVQHLLQHCSCQVWPSL